MLKFINSLATIEVNKEIEAIQVVFSGSGTMQHYLETLRMATSFARLHNTTTYLLAKSQFDDINCQQFYDTIEGWLHGAFNPSGLHKVRVALLTNQNSCRELLEKEMGRIAPKDYLCEPFSFFSDKEKALGFFKTNPVGKSYQRI